MTVEMVDMKDIRGRALALLPRWLGGLKADNIFWLTPVLGVGGAAMLREPNRLRKLGIRAVLDMQAEAGDRGAELATSSVSYLKLPVDDFAAPRQEQLDQATGWILERLGNDEPVFIHCREGLGRSVTVAIATLLRMGYDLPRSYSLIRGARAEISLSESQLGALRRYAESLKQAARDQQPVDA